MEAATLLKVIQIGATVASVIGNISQGRAASQQAEYQARVSEQQAQREREVARNEEEDYRRQQRRILAQRMAALGASGVELGTGTPLLAAQDFATETELQALRIRAGGETSASRLRQESVLTRAAGESTARSAYFRAGSSLLTGIGKVYGSTTKPKSRITGTQSTI